jgi:hypothetical protein
VTAISGALSPRTVTFPRSGTYQIRVCARDVVGNVGGGSVTSVVIP